MKVSYNTDADKERRLFEAVRSDPSIGYHGLLRRLGMNPRTFSKMLRELEHDGRLHVCPGRPCCKFVLTGAAACAAEKSL